LQLSTIGHISLNISTLIYFIWFVPQLILNFKRKTTSGLSIWMHAILFLGYLADLMYGFGQHLPIQYRLVTMVGLVSLCLEHYQFGRYGLKQHRDKLVYTGLTVFFSILFIFVIINLFIDTHSNAYYNVAGFVSSFCWFAFVWPQVIKNFKHKSTRGLSTKFVALAVATGVLDTITAYALNWPLPSKISAPIGLVQKSLLLSQCFYYDRKTKAEVKYA